MIVSRIHRISLSLPIGEACESFPILLNSGKVSPVRAVNANTHYQVDQIASTTDLYTKNKTLDTGQYGGWRLDIVRD